MKKVKIDQYNNDWYNAGSSVKKILWYFTNMLFYKTLFPFPSSFKAKLLNLFGAKIGKDVVIKPNVNIKYPWFLEVPESMSIQERHRKRSPEPPQFFQRALVRLPWLYGCREYGMVSRQLHTVLVFHEFLSS